MIQIENRKRPAAAILGFSVILFAIIGVVSTVLAIVQMVSAFLDNSAQKKEFEKIIYPVVMFDPVPFENAASADQMLLLQSSMWANLLNENTNKYSTNDIGFMLIPSIDLDAWCMRMYGDTVKLEHQTIEGSDTVFYYDRQTQMYHVPASVELVHYSPRVEEIQRNGDTYILRVGYLSPTNITTNIFDDEHEEPVPDKYLYYVLTKTDNNYLITGVRSTTSQLPPEDVSDISSDTSEESSKESSKNSSEDSSTILPDVSSQAPIADDEIPTSDETSSEEESLPPTNDAA